MFRFDAAPPAAKLVGDDSSKLLGAAQALASARDVARVMEVVRRTARDLTGADGVTFVLREGDQVHYADEEAISPLWKGCRFPAQCCISGWSMIHRETVVVEDIYRDDRIPHDVYRQTFVKSLAMVPVGQEEPIAAIGAYWARRHRATGREVQLLESLAGFAAPALANDALLRDLRLALRARDEFIAIAAHELRTPLSALGLTLETGLRARERGAGDELELLRTAVARGQKQAERLGKLVNTLLDVSRLEHGRPSLVRDRLDLTLMAADVVERAREAARSEITLRSDGPVVGEWDAARIEQVLENLVANAVKFGSGNPVEVAVSLLEDQARVVVEDRGIGIPPEDHGRIFEKLERAVPTRNFGGFGLGLWIVRQNVEAHGGTVHVDSRPGAGSRFTALLPVTR